MMKITTIHCFLVEPGKGEHNLPEMKRAKISLRGDLYDLLKSVFEEADTECNIPTQFVSDGSQNNPVRSEIMSTIKSRRIDSTQKLAKRLQDSTNRQSGKGLVFFIFGNSGNSKKLVISRFPVDIGVIADVGDDTTNLNVEFVKQLFLRNARSYKAALFNESSHNSDYWHAAVVDKQAGHDNKSAAYWTELFLQSTEQTTSKHGTKRLALAIKKTITDRTLGNNQHHLVRSVVAASSLKRRRISVIDFCNHFQLPKNVKDCVVDNMQNPDCANDPFILDIGEFEKHISYRLDELDNGVLIGAETATFDDVVKTRRKKDGPETTYSITGTLTDTKLRSGRPR